MSSPLLVGHLVSGGGTTMENVARQMVKEERVITLYPTILEKAKAAAIKIYPTK